MSEFFVLWKWWQGKYEWSFFLCKWWEPILASVSEFQRKYKDGWIQDGQIHDGEIQDGYHHQVRWEWMSSESDWISLSQSQSGVRVFLSESERRYQVVWILDGSGWIQDGRIQDGCHHQEEWERMSLNQIELVWVRVLCKMAKSKMAKFIMLKFRMAAIIKLSQNEWVWVRLN